MMSNRIKVTLAVLWTAVGVLVCGAGFAMALGSHGGEDLRPQFTATATPTGEGADLGYGQPGAPCATNRLGKAFVKDGVTYTCGGAVPYHWLAGASSAPAAPTIKDGTWTVGEDMPAGTYKVIGAGERCYWSITASGSNGSDIVDNHLGGGNLHVTLKAGQDFESKRCGTWVKQA